MLKNYLSGPYDTTAEVVSGCLWFWCQITWCDFKIDFRGISLNYVANR